MEQFFVGFLPRNTFMPKYFPTPRKNQFTALYTNLIRFIHLVTSSQKSFSHKCVCIIPQLILVHCDKNFCRKSFGNVIAQLFWKISFLSFLIASLICYKEVMKIFAMIFQKFLQEIKFMRISIIIRNIFIIDR